jgi:ribosome-associated protein
MAKKTAKKKTPAKAPKKLPAKKPPAKASAAKKPAKSVAAPKKKAAPKAAKKPSPKTSAKTSAKVAKKSPAKPMRKSAAAKVAKKPVKKAAKRTTSKQAAGSKFELDVTPGATFNPDTTEATNFAEDALAQESDARSILDESPAIPPSRDDLLTTASPSHAAALRQLRETDPTYAAGVVDAKTFATNAARLLHDDNCSDVMVLDVHGLRQDCDYIVIGSGTSDRQMRGVAKEVEQLGEKQGFKVYRKHADERATWILADFVHVVVHLFEPNTRATYDIEMMWADAPRLAWEREDQVNRNRAGVG